MHSINCLLCTNFSVNAWEVVYVTVGNPAFWFAWYLTSKNFRGELQHDGHVDEQKIKCQPIRTRGIAGPWLQDELYDGIYLKDHDHIFRKLVDASSWKYINHGLTFHAENTFQNFVFILVRTPWLFLVTW